MFSSLLGIIVAVVFQSIFYLKIHHNNIFFILKNLFLTSIYQNNMKTLKNINLKKIKIILKHKNKLAIKFFNNN
jgi:hypothetical protein